MQVFVPPFLNQKPFEDETMTGRAARCLRIAGAAARAEEASTAVNAPNAEAEARNSRLCME
jgi:hypothetical protein